MKRRAKGDLSRQPLSRSFYKRHPLGLPPPPTPPRTGEGGAREPHAGRSSRRAVPLTAPQVHGANGWLDPGDTGLRRCRQAPGRQSSPGTGTRSPAIPFMRQRWGQVFWGSQCRHTEHDGRREMWLSARASEMRRRRSWNRPSAQEPGAAVRIPRLAGGQTIQAPMRGPDVAMPSVRGRPGSVS